MNYLNRLPRDRPSCQSISTTVRYSRIWPGTTGDTKHSLREESVCYREAYVGYRIKFSPLERSTENLRRSQRFGNAPDTINDRPTDGPRGDGQILRQTTGIRLYYLYGKYRAEGTSGYSTNRVRKPTDQLPTLAQSHLDSCLHSLIAQYINPQDYRRVSYPRY